jgi:CPA1 family monovalent cation:H+ antiporter
MTRLPPFLVASLAAVLLAGCTTTQGETLPNEQFLVVEEIVIALLFLSAIVGIVARRLRLPYTVGLVLMGLALALRGQFEINITPNLILGLLVPPLIFEAAFHLNLRELRRNLAPVLAFAILGVIITTLLVGGIVARGTGLPLSLALVFGALVSATDPVSVVALFRSMGIPKRLQVLLEGESLLNDGTAIVIFNLVVVAALSTTQRLNLSANLVEFIVVSGGGLVVGLVLGTILSHVMERVDDYLIETTLTSVLAYGAYLIAEMLGVSGVLAVVAAGLVNGNISPRGMSPTTRIVVFNFWEYAAFLSNSFVFLLIGLQMDLGLMFANWQLILWAIGGVLLARAVTVYGLAWIGKLEVKWQHVLFWGGLRGAISLALALSLPLGLGRARDQLQAMAFGVVLFTLLVQGFSMGPLVQRLRLVQPDEKKDEYQRRHARAVASRRASEHLAHMSRQGLISEHTWQTLAAPLKEHNQALVNSVREAISADPSVQVAELDISRREYLRSQRSSFAELLRDGVISDETYSQLLAEVDAALASNESYWADIMIASEARSKSINRLITAVVQEQDAENAISALDKLGFSITRLPSSGGFLGRRNVTLLIGLAQGREEQVTSALYQSCRTRVEYVTLPLEGSPMPLTTPTPITVGGATLFAFDIERYEEL